MKGQKVKRTQDGSIGNAKKRTRTSKRKETPSNNSFNWMDEAFLRFPHLPEQIMEKLDFKSLMNARVVAISWKQFIDAREHRWYPFKNKIADLKEICLSDETPFHLVCRNGQAELAEIIMKNSAKLNINLNAKNNILGWTAFHLACSYGHSKIAEMILKNSAKINIELNAKDNYGLTAFHLACMDVRTSIVDMMINNSESLNLDLTAKTNIGNTGFKLAQDCGRTDVVNLIRSKMPRIAI